MSIFSFVADEIEEQVQQFQRQGEQTDRVMQNIRTGMNPIQGGAWTGQGAKAFINEIVSKLLPQIAELIAAIAGFGGGIGKALGVVMQADKMVSGIVEQVGSTFESIF